MAQDLSLTEKTLQSRDFIQNTINGLMNKGLTEIEAQKYLTAFRRLFKEKGGDKLANCTIDSIKDCLALSAELQLCPEKTLGFIYFLPYGDKCTPIIGARGMKSLLLRNPDVLNVKTIIVREGDTVFYEETHNETSLRYRSDDPFADHTKQIKGIIAYLERKNQNRYFVFMSKAEVDTIKNKAKTQEFWNNYYEEMMKKTIIRRLFKEVPLLLKEDIELKIAKEDTDMYGNQKIELQQKDVEQSYIVSTTDIANNLKEIKV